MFIAELKKMGFVQSLADPCLLFFRDERGVIYFVIYADDCIIIATTEDLMKQFKKDIGKALISRNLVNCGSTWVVSLNKVETRSKWFSQI